MTYANYWWGRYVAWPSQQYFSMDPKELLMFKPSENGRSAEEEAAFIDDVDRMMDVSRCTAYYTRSELQFVAVHTWVAP